MAGRPSLHEVVRALEPRHEIACGVRLRDPWELVLWETCVFAADDETRKRVFDRLKSVTSLDPKKILSAPEKKVVAALAEGGMMARYRYDKLKLNTKRLLDMGPEALRAATKKDPRAARKLLKRFHGIGDPGADRVLMFAGTAKTIGADAAVVRVLVRVGFGEESKDWSRSYRTSAKAIEPELPDERDELVHIHMVLRAHGRDVCKNTRPTCGDCPLLDRCAHAKKTLGARGGADDARAVEQKVAAWERMWRSRGRR